MSIRDTSDLFYKRIIEQYKKTGDTENAEKCEEFYKMLTVQRKMYDEDNQGIVAGLLSPKKIELD